LAVFIAFVVVLVGFSVLSLSAPMGYPEDSLWEHGLVRGIVFDAGDYRSPCFVRGRLVLVNPSNVDVFFDLAYPILYEVSFESGYPSSRRWDGESLRVTVPARGEYTVTSFSFKAYAPGFYEVDWDGLRRGITVGRGDLIPRLVTEKQVYDQYENGYVTVEYYNPKPYPVMFTPPLTVKVDVEYNGVKQNTGMGSYISWIRDSFTVPSGGTFKISTYYFVTPEAGYLTMKGMGASKTLIVLPVER
jgi:hypothetical protein